MTQNNRNLLHDLNLRSKEIFQELVQLWLESGNPVGSRTLAQALESHHNRQLSPATIRNSLVDLQKMGLLESSHASAARQPTVMGIRLFIDAFFQTEKLDRRKIQTIAQSVSALHGNMANIPELLTHLTQQASFVVTPPRPVSHYRHIEFLPLKNKILAILVADDGRVTNRLFSLPTMPEPSTLVEIGNYLTAMLEQKTQPSLKEILSELNAQISSRKQQVDNLSQALLKLGIELIHSPTTSTGHVLVRGYDKLIDDPKASQYLNRLQDLLLSLEKGESLFNLVERLDDAQEVSIFVGADNDLFEHTGWSVIMSPLKDTDSWQTVGAIGIIGSSAMNYRQIVPVVTYTAEMLSGVLDNLMQGYQP